jgi:hypothetical protein
MQKSMDEMVKELDFEAGYLISSYKSVNIDAPFNDLLDKLDEKQLLLNKSTFDMSADTTQIMTLKSTFTSTNKMPQNSC